jgi:hypothetical protein
MLFDDHQKGSGSRYLDQLSASVKSEASSKYNEQRENKADMLEGTHGFETEGKDSTIVYPGLCESDSFKQRCY